MAQFIVQVVEGMITMSIGSRIRFIRLKRGYTQKELGMKLGFKESTAEVRIAQYETDARIPREALLNRIAKALGVEADALITDTKTNIGLLHFLFSLEDESCFCIRIMDGTPVITVDESNKTDSAIMLKDMIMKWAIHAEALRNGKITQEEYDNWRYKFPKEYGTMYGIPASWDFMLSEIGESALGARASSDFDDQEFLDLESSDLD